MSATKKIVKPAAHPPYGEMVKAAIRELKDRKGSSRQAIIKYIRANFKVSATENVESFVRRSLVAGVKGGRFVHTKGVGASGSFKLADKAAASKAKKPATKKAAAPKKASTTKKTPKKAVKKPAAKRATPKKAKSPAKKAKPAAKKVKTPKRAGAKKPAAKKPMKK
jgi:histone H1/5